MRRFVRVLVSAMACAVLFAPTFSTNAQPELFMRSARISWPGAGSHFFWQVAASPTNPDHVVACSLLDSSMSAHSIEAVIYTSIDGGDTWNLMKETADFPTNSEVACATSGDNVIYFSLSVGADLPSALHHTYDRMYLWRSPDFGQTWRLSPHIGYSDAALLLVKKNPAGLDRVYDFADSRGTGADSEDRFMTIFDNDATVIRKTRSWNPAPAPPLDAYHCGQKPKESTELFDIPALPARPGACINGVTIMEPVDLGGGLIGALYIDWNLKPPQHVHLSLTRLTDDGKPIGTPVLIATLSLHDAQLQAQGSFFAENNEPTIASGRLPGSDASRAYVGWHDVVDGHDRVVLTTSNDRGATWGPIRPIDDSAARRVGSTDPVPSDVSLAVNKDGVVAASWSEFYGRCWRIALSHDGGQSFGSSAPINPCDRDAPLSMAQALGGHIYALSNGSMVFNSTYNPGSGFSITDFRRQFEWLLRGTSLTAAADGSFYQIWSVLSGHDDQFHATRIAMPGQVQGLAAHRKAATERAVCCLKPHGDAELYYTSYDYDPATHEFEIGAILARKRGFGGNGPIVMRLKSISSVLGPVHASNADNDISGAGAAWVFEGNGGANGWSKDLPESSASGNIALLPSGQYEYSDQRLLRFRVDGNLTHESWLRPPMSPMKGNNSINSEIVSVSVDLLSTP